MAMLNGQVGTNHPRSRSRVARAAAYARIAGAQVRATRAPAWDDLRERGSASRGRLLRPGGAVARGGRPSAAGGRPRRARRQRSMRARCFTNAGVFCLAHWRRLIADRACDPGSGVVAWLKRAWRGSLTARTRPEKPPAACGADPTRRVFLIGRMSGKGHSRTCCHRSSSLMRFASIATRARGAEASTWPVPSASRLRASASGSRLLLSRPSFRGA
jgi:hypothetical protein